MRNQFNRLGQIQAENTHNGLCINCIPAGNQIDIVVEAHYCIDEFLNIIDCIQLNFVS